MKTLRKTMQRFMLIAVAVALVFAGFGISSALASNTVEKFPIGDVYFYGLYDKESFNSTNNCLNTIADTTWSTLDGRSVTFTKEDGIDKYYIAGTADDAGVYYYSHNGKTYYMDAKMPSAVVTGKVYENNAGYAKDEVISSLIGNTVNNKNVINLSVLAKLVQTDPEKEVTNYFTVSGLMFTNPDGTLTTSDIPGTAVKIFCDGTYNYYTYLNESMMAMDIGTWTVQAYFKKGNANGFSNLAPSTMLGEKYTFTIINAYTPKKPGVITVSTQDLVVQGENIEITGTAEGNPNNVLIYVFGTNFFNATSAAVLNDGTYSVSQKIVRSDEYEAGAWSMATGMYYLVAQHPMYNNVYNIAPVKNAHNYGYDIKLNRSVGLQVKLPDGTLVKENDKNPDNIGTILFNTIDRQSANAAYALIEAINDYISDDMQAHRSFQVAGPTTHVNAIPSQVTKGQKLIISGSTTGHKNDIVTVELLSTAISKESADSSEFATRTTKIDDDGTWFVSFDTTNMNIGDYNVSVAVGSLDPGTTKTKIVNSGFVYTLYQTDTPTSIVGGPLHLMSEGIITPDEVKSGERVNSTFMVKIYNGDFAVSSSIALKSDLLSPTWTVDIYADDVLMTTVHPTYSIGYSIAGFDLRGYNADVVLKITVSGIIPNTESDNICVAQAVASGSAVQNGLKSYSTTMVKNGHGPSAEFYLSPGWNFISVPKKLSADYDTAGELFSEVDTGGNPILMYDTQTKSWTQAAASTKISPLNAYWIYSVSTMILPYEFDSAPSLPPTKSVYTGWNAVGLSAEEAMEAEAAFGNTDWYSFVSWNSANQKYNSPIIEGNTGTYAETTKVLPWAGGWLYVNSDGTYLGYA